MMNEKRKSDTKNNEERKTYRKTACLLRSLTGRKWSTREPFVLLISTLKRIICLQ